LKLTKAIEQYLHKLEADGRSPLTIEVYGRELANLDKFLGNINVSRLNSELIHEFVVSDTVQHKPDGSPRGPATISRTKATLRSFGRFLEETGLVPANPARDLRISRTPRKEPAFLTAEEKKRLVKAVAAHRGDAADRDRVILELFLGTGIRLAELVNIDLPDVRLDQKRLVIKSAKGGQPETRFLNTRLRTILRKHLRARRRAFAHDPALFLSNRSTRITARQVERRFSKWLEWAGISKKLSVHSLRHTFATHLYGRTRNLVLVSKALGHRQVSTTQVYTHLFDDELEDALEAL